MAKGKAGLKASATAVDPTLDALFSSSSGPVKAPSKARYSELVPIKDRASTKQSENADAATQDDQEEEDDESLSELDSEDKDSETAEQLLDEEDDEDESNLSEKAEPADASQPRQKDRKRKRRDEHDDIEDKYMRKIAEEEEREQRREKRRKGEAGKSLDSPAPQDGENSGEVEEDDSDNVPIVHESLQKTNGDADIELDKANRTLFLGNVSSEAITSSKAKKLLVSHLESCLSELDSASGPHKIESIRFRSTPFSTGAMPKRAAFITKSLMSSTTKSTNAYAVYTTSLAARTALKELNASVILDRHLRVDSVAHPAPIAHRRCVFVGNLGFVDDETVVNTDAEGETTTKKRHKVPSDTEEGLWRIFGEHAGKVESVRVPRDEKTRVGKGFAYVQFYDGNDVEAALLLNEKKFPPMLPRALRVSRAKDPRKTSNAMERSTKAKGGPPSKSKSTKYTPKITPEQQSLAGRAERLFGRATAARQRKDAKGGRREPRVRAERTQENGGGDGIKPPEQFIFEGRRASSKDGKPKDLKFGKTKGKKGAVRAKAKSRGAKRAAEWRKSKA